jgi:hypothetical protein
LQRKEKATVEHLLEPKTKKYYHEFFQCTACGQVYWKGSHYPRLKARIERWRAFAAPAGSH